MSDIRDFGEIGSRWYSSNEPSLVRTDTLSYQVYAVQVVTDTVISASSLFALGYDGDSNVFGVTLTPGIYYLRFSKFVATSGTGLVYIS